MTKTEASLIAKIESAKRAGESRLAVSGQRECAAARKLAEQGHGLYRSHSKVVTGESYFDPFRRCWASKRSYAVIEGVLTLNA